MSERMPDDWLAEMEAFAAESLTISIHAHTLHSMIKELRERRARIMHARETKAMCDLQRAIDTAPSVSTEYLRGIDDSIARVKSRQAHYELYREGDMMKTHPATFAILDEVLVFLGSLREQALSTKDPSDE